MTLEGKVVVVTGGTGSLGQVLVRRLLTLEGGKPRKVVVLSRDEAKQHSMRLEFSRSLGAGARELEFRLGDVRDLNSLKANLRNAQVVINAAALKAVPTCEYFPYEAYKTNVEGAQNIVWVAQELGLETVIGISTDKACKPVSVMGMTKALQEKIFNHAGLVCPDTRFVSVRYGNVLASRGSMIPYFIEQIQHGGPVTVTSREMTRFLLSLEQAVEVVFEALKSGRTGETFVPRIRSARVWDIAKILVGDRPVEIRETGVRPGEKTHEILVSDEEAPRTFSHGNYYVISPTVPELSDNREPPALSAAYSSLDSLMEPEELGSLLSRHGLALNATEPRTLLR